MQSKTIALAELLKLRHVVRHNKPLIHCITNPISINDCANAVLALGAKPIMAEHPEEVCEITATAQALAVNLGNITDIRMESMLRAGKYAADKQIPAIIDLVGVGCSSLRLKYAKNWVKECRPKVIKGNLSEIKAFCGLPNSAKGIDAGKEDQIYPDSVSLHSDLLVQLARSIHATVIATGPVDLITDGDVCYQIQNGCEMLSYITGSGCMLNVLTATFLSYGSGLEAGMLASLLMGICGELAQGEPGPASFRTKLLDEFFSISDELLQEKGKIKKI